MRTSLITLALAAVASAQRRETRTFTIDLDNAPEDRFHVS